MVDAVSAVGALLEAPGLVLLAEAGGHWQELRSVIEKGLVAGPVVHDARVAALCRLHGVSELWSADRDFSRFPELALRNPLVG
jgi:predicted nucleic acid-binding protein